MPESDLTSTDSKEIQIPVESSHFSKKYWANRIRTAWRKLLHEDATPNRIALGFGLGLFMAYFPAPILDTLIALALAYLFRANRAACLIGNNFVLLLFPIIPFVFGLEFIIGSKLLHETGVSIVPKDWNLWMFLCSQGPNYRALVVGAFVLAVPSGLLSFILVRSATQRWQAYKKASAQTTS